MKRLLLTVGLFLTTLSAFAQATQKADGARRATVAQSTDRVMQTGTDLTKIMLACINQAGLEKYYSSQEKGAINIAGLPEGTQLPANANARGRSINVHGIDKLRSGALSNYFYFSNVKNDNGHINVSMTYFYDHSKAGYKVVMVNMELVKNGSQYQIVNSNFKGDLL